MAWWTMTSLSHNRRTFVKLAGTALGGTALAGCSGLTGGDGGPAEWAVAGAIEGSPANTWVEGWAQMLEEHDASVKFLPQLAVGGWQRSITRVGNEQTDACMTFNRFTYESQRDQGLWAEGGEIGPLNNEVVQIFPTIHESHWFFVTYKDNDINSLSDLEGKTIGMFSRGELNTQHIVDVLEAAGVTRDNAQFNHLGSHVDIANAIQSRNVDASAIFAVNGVILPPPYVNAATSVDLTNIPIPSDVQSAAQEIDPLLKFGEISGGDLNQPLDFDTTTSTVDISAFVTRKNMPTEDVRSVVSTIFENETEMDEYHPALGLTGFEDSDHHFSGVTEGTRFHEGAIQYFESRDDLSGVSWNDNNEFQRTG